MRAGVYGPLRRDCSHRRGVCSGLCGVCAFSRASSRHSLIAADAATVAMSAVAALRVARSPARSVARRFTSSSVSVSRETSRLAAPRCRRLLHVAAGALFGSAHDLRVLFGGDDAVLCCLARRSRRVPPRLFAKLDAMTSQGDQSCGAVIARVRAAKAVDLADLAAGCGISQQRVRDLESGRADVDGDDLAAVSEHLGVSPAGDTVP